MNNQFQLTEDQRAIQKMAQRFTADNITPHAGEWDERAHFPVEVIRKTAELGFGAIYVSEESGGIGLGRLESALIMEAMDYGCPTTSAFVSIHNMAAWMIDKFGDDALKSRYLPDLVTMNTMASYCLTEPGSGSDASGLKTSAVREGDHYVLNGTKQFISGAGVNDIYVTMVRTGEDKTNGITCLVVEKDTPGVSFGAPERKLGWRASPTAQVIFEDARVPVANRVGAEGEGFRFAMMGLDGGRLNIGACSLGGAQRCLDEAIAYTKERQQFGAPIAEFQNPFSTSLRRRSPQMPRTSRAFPPWRNGLPPTMAARSPTMRCNCSAAMDISRITPSNGSGAICASTPFSKARTR